MKMVRLMEIPRSICREDALAPDNTKALRLVLIVAFSFSMQASTWDS